jgi:hypothetical protein
VYSVTGEGGVGVSAAFFKLTKVYDHSLGVAGLHFTAFNMTHGPFGNVSGVSACDCCVLCIYSAVTVTVTVTRVALHCPDGCALLAQAVLAARYAHQLCTTHDGCDGLRVCVCVLDCTLDCRSAHHMCLHGCCLPPLLLFPCPGRDYVCVQSMDGQLSFYEQDHPSFTRQLERCLVPGPICYVAKTDSIVIATCEMTVEAYKYVACSRSLALFRVVPVRCIRIRGGDRQLLASLLPRSFAWSFSAALAHRFGRALSRYQALAAASLSHPGERKDDGAYEAGASSSGVGKGGAGRSLKVDWSVNIGEHVFSIGVGRLSRGLRPSQVDIVVVGNVLPLAVLTPPLSLSVLYRAVACACTCGRYRCTFAVLVTQVNTRCSVCASRAAPPPSAFKSAWSTILLL